MLASNLADNKAAQVLGQKAQRRLIIRQIWLKKIARQKIIFSKYRVNRVKNRV
jgi:hypothetical protein